MQGRRKKIISLLAAGVVSVGGAVMLASAAQGASATYTTPLFGHEETSSPGTHAHGVAQLRLSADGTELSYRLVVANIEDVLMAHIHVGEPGADGPVVAWLYPSAPPPQLIPGTTQGVLATGTITADDLVGPLDGMALPDLLDAMDAGSTYVNVHTSANPGGEIRGQLD